MKCKDCKYYNAKDSYKGTGYCALNIDYVKETDCCEDWEVEDE